MHGRGRMEDLEGRAAAGGPILPTLEDQRWTAGVTVVVVTLFFVFLVNSYCAEIFALATPAIARDWGVEPKLLAGSMAIGWLGSGLGSMLGGVLGDKIGRHRTIFWVSMVAALATLGSAFATRPEEMLLGRALAGLGLGAAVPPALALIAECVPVRRRGFVISIGMICGPMGIAASAAVAALVLPAYGWKAFFVVSGGASIAVTLAFAVLGVESPRYLLRLAKGGARLTRSLRRLGVSLAAGAPEAARVPPDGAERASPALILSRAFRGTTLRIWICFAAMFISVSAMLSWVPTAFAAVSFTPAAISGALSAWSFGGVAGTLIAGWCMSRWGSRRASQGFALASALAVAVFIALPPSPRAGQLLLVAPMAVSGLALSALITGLYGYVTEAYPANIRSTGVGLAAMVGRSSAVVGSFGGVYVLSGFGLRGFFAGIALLALLPLLLLWASRRARPAPPAAVEQPA